MNIFPTFQTLDDWYTEHRVANVPYWVTQNYLYKKLDELPKYMFKQNIAGESTERRLIRFITLGNGSTSVLIWSQMHGDEPTATRALLDMFSVIQNRSDSELIKTILSKLTLYILPMLNPDGAERFTRRTAMGIDINRDALALRTPEARILKSVRDTYNTRWAYSLHDQEPRYTVGGTGKAAGISLLAPARDWELSVDELRRDTMRLAVCIGEYIKQIIPDQIGRYDDALEPRAFGEALHVWGTRSVLIESGYIPRERSKETIRKANTIGLLASLYHLANKELPPDNLYYTLPINRRYFTEYVFKNAGVYFNGAYAGTHDVAFHLENNPHYESKEISYKLCLTEIGDCSPYTASYVLNGSKIKIQFTVESGSTSRLPVIDETVHCEIIGTGGDERIAVKDGVPSGNPEEVFGKFMQ